MVTYDFESFLYTNLGSVKSTGIESSLKIRPLKMLEFEVEYTYTYAVNQVSGLMMFQIPMHKGNISAEFQPVSNFSLNLNAVYTGTKYDFGGAVIPEHWVTGVSLLYRWKKADFYGNIDNLFNVKYIETEGYNTSGINFTAGIRYHL